MTEGINTSIAGLDSKGGGPQEALHTSVRRRIARGSVRHRWSQCSPLVQLTGRRIGDSCSLRSCRIGHSLEENDVDNHNEPTGRDLQQIRLWCTEVGDINSRRLKNHTSTLRAFPKWCASIEAAPENLLDTVMVQRLSPADE